MVKIISYDFKELETFISSYSLSSSVGDPKYMIFLSQIHKKYYALLLFLSELQRDGFSFITSSYNLDSTASSALVNYTKESISDLGIALFSWIHGSYKSSRMLTRSSIENIVRGISTVEDSSICKVTLTHLLFERAQRLKIFSRGQIPSYLSALKGNYSILCADVHAAAPLNMEHVSALSYFPAFDYSKAEDTAKIIIQVAQRLLVLLSLCFRDFVFKMHPSNVEVIFLCLPREIKTEIHNP